MARLGALMLLENQRKQYNKPSYIISRRFAFISGVFRRNSYKQGPYEVTCADVNIMCYKTAKFYLQVVDDGHMYFTYKNYQTDEQLFFTGTRYDTECRPTTFAWFVDMMRKETNSYHIFWKLVKNIEIAFCKD